MKEEIICRLAKAEDVSGIIEVARITWNDAYDGIIPTALQAELLAKWYSPERIRKSLQRSDSWFYVADHEGAVVGYAQFLLQGGGRGEMSRLYVLPAWQGRRIGSRLLEAGKRTLAQNGAKELLAKVETQNEKSIRFYERKGFRRGREFTEEVSDIKLPHVEYILML